MKGLTTGFGIEYCCNNNIRYENKCYVNVKVYFKIVCVRVRVCVRPYLPFPTTHELGQQLLPQVIKRFILFIFSGISEGRFLISICLCDSIIIVKAFFKVVVVDVDPSKSS